MKELETRGVKVSTEISYRTPIGRLMPDILLCNGAEYVVETKLGAEAKLLDAMVQLYDYSKYTQTNGGFAVLFPKELRRPWGIEIIEKIVVDPKLKYIATATFKDNRASQRFVGNLSEMADWIATHVLRAPAVEADTGFAIKVLTEAVEALTASVRALKETELEDIFGGKTVFENILQYEEGRYPLDEMKQAATYLLANQIIFYHVLSKMDLAFEDIDEDKIGKPNDLLNYFNPVLEKDYSSIFGFDVASRLPDSSTKIIKKVIMAVKALAPEKIGHDVLGKVFHELIPFNIRKSVAAFYTNNEAAEILAQLSIDDPDAKVMDLAVGSGTLLVAAYRRKRELKKKLGTYDLSKDHKKFLEEDLTGIDIMPFAAHLAVMHLSLQALLSETEKVRVAVWDSTGLKPGMTIPAIHSELKAAYKRPTLDMFKDGNTFLKDAYIKKGAITLEGLGGEEIPLKKADLVIMNPPFTRQERLPKQYKTSLSKRLEEYEEYIHGQLGLHGYFILLADRFVSKDGKTAFVLPATTLRLRSAKGIRELLSRRHQIQYIITTWQRAAFSEGAQFREILLITKKLDGNNKEQGFENLKCGIVKLKKLPQNMEEARIFALQIDSIVRKSHLKSSFTNENMFGRIISQKQLRNTIDNWFVYISSYSKKTEDLWNSFIEKGSSKLELFEKILEKEGARIFEGLRARSHMINASIGSLFIVRYSSRANKREDRWVFKSLGKKELIAEDLVSHDTVSIPVKSLKYGLRRLSGINYIDLSDKLDFVITKNFKNIEMVFSNTNRVPQKKELTKWQKYVNEKLSKLAIAARFDISATGTSLFSWYSSKPMAGCGVVCNIKGLDDENAKIISLWFNSSINALQLYLKRIETRGAWMRLDKYVIEKLLVLNPNLLTKQERKMLFSVFEDIRSEPFPSFLEQLKTRYSPRVKLDKVILAILGFDEKAAEQIIEELYPALANEIEQLKTLMAG
jgi:type I restriction-modification system DNA methylase subunit